MIKPVAVSVAGLDTGNGAGIEADLKTFEILGIHALLVLTAITSQNTLGIQDIFPVPQDKIKSQIIALKQDFKIRGVKVGMIYNREQFEIVNKELKEIEPFVVDPVIFAKDGTQLIRDLDDYKRLILKDSTVITPNVPEASMLSGIRIENINDMITAGKKIKETYNIRYVIIKGGHLTSHEYSFDILIGDSNIHLIGYKRLAQKNTHGTGSVFASTILSFLIKGYDIEDSFRNAKKLVYNAIVHGLEIGNGIGPIDPIVDLEKRAMKYKVMEEMIEVAEILTSLPNFYKLIPEVQSNIAHSIEPNYVDSLLDIATFKGRIVREWDNKVRIGLPPVFGKPTHTARLLYAIISKRINANSLINIRYDDRIIKILKDIGYDIVEVDRESEPPHGEGMTMQWIVEKVFSEYGKVPNVIFDKGAKGKEPMIRLWTSSINELIDTLAYISKNF